MRFKRQNILCSIVSGLILMSVIMSLGYTLSRRYNKMSTPYGLSNNYMKFTREFPVEVDFNKIFNVDVDQNITVVSEYEGLNYITLYDPRYFFYNQKMVTAIGGTRYFSDSDYKQRTKTGILVSDKNLFEGFSDTSNIRSSMIDECIFHINSYSTLYKPDIEYIINMTSVQYLGDKIYVDYDNYQDYKKIEEKLTKYGYKIEDTKSIKTIVLMESAIKNHNIYESSLIISSLSMYPIFLFTCILFFYNNKKIIVVNKLCGGEKNKVFVIISKKFLACNFIICTLSGFIAYITYSKDLLRQIPFLDFLFLIVVHLLIINMNYFVGFHINFKRLEL